MNYESSKDYKVHIICFMTIEQKEKYTEQDLNI